MKELLTIKEFSMLTGIEQTTLRYWDEIGLFSPVKRDPDNNYRYYSPKQFVAVHFITFLSGLNVPLKTIGAMADARTPEGVISLIERQEKLLDMEMRRLRESYSVIHTRLELIKYGIKLEDGYLDAGCPEIDGSKVCVMHGEETPFILGPPNEFKEGGSFYEPFMHFYRMAGEMRVNLNYPIGGYHESIESFIEAPGKPERFFSMDPTGNRARKAGDNLVGFTRGYYGEMGDIAERMSSYAKENSLTLSGPVYTLYLHDEICVKDPSQYLVQICVAAEKRVQRGARRNTAGL